MLPVEEDGLDCWVGLGDPLLENCCAGAVTGTPFLHYGTACSLQISCMSNKLLSCQSAHQLQVSNTAMTSPLSNGSISAFACGDLMLYTSEDRPDWSHTSCLPCM